MFKGFIWLRVGNDRRRMLVGKVRYVLERRKGVVGLVRRRGREKRLALGKGTD